MKRSSPTKISPVQHMLAIPSSFLVVLAVLVPRTPVLAQVHAIRTGTLCHGPVCEGETTRCEVAVGHADGFGDTIRIHAAWQYIDPGDRRIRVPAQGPEVVGDVDAAGHPIGNDDGICQANELCMGNLHVAAVEGNAACSDADPATGLYCEPWTGRNCVLPCILGPGASTLQQLPGDPQPGYLVLSQDEYVVDPVDPDHIAVQTTVLWEDLCDSSTTESCASIISVYQTGSAVDVTRCGQADPCEIATCTSGECRFEPVPCDDHNSCTQDLCDIQTGLCTYVPLESLPDYCDSGEGCSAAYWVRSAHLRKRLSDAGWPATLTPDAEFCVVLAPELAECPFPGRTLLQVLRARGGTLQSLGRQTVAAMLNAASDELLFEFAPEEVVAIFNDAFLAGPSAQEAAASRLATYNEALCPLGRGLDRKPGRTAG